MGSTRVAGLAPDICCTTSYKTNVACPKLYPQHRAHAQPLTTNVGCPKMYPQQRSHAQPLTNPTWHAQNCILSTEHTHNFLQNQRGVPKNVSTAKITRTNSYKSNVACPKLYPQHRAHARLLTKPTWGAQKCIHSTEHTHNFLQQTWDAQN